MKEGQQRQAKNLVKLSSPRTASVHRGTWSRYQQRLRAHMDSPCVLCPHRAVFKFGQRWTRIHHTHIQCGSVCHLWFQRWSKTWAIYIYIYYFKNKTHTPIMRPDFWQSFQNMKLPQGLDQNLKFLHTQTWVEWPLVSGQRVLQCWNCIFPLSLSVGSLCPASEGMLEPRNVEELSGTWCQATYEKLASSSASNKNI